MSNIFQPRHYILLLVLLGICCGLNHLANALPLPYPLKTTPNQQLLVVTPNKRPLSEGSLQRYQRDSHNSIWQAIGHPIPVVIGKNGMGQAADNSNHQSPSQKQEGDQRTPAGVFAIGPAFGYADKEAALKLPYLRLQDTTVCVDDARSAYYNKVVATQNIATPDWHSGEMMRKIPNYRFGIIVQYNQPKVVPHAGSCIFMHIWSGPHVGTTGCIAMSEENLLAIMHWLDTTKKPQLVTLLKQSD